PLPCGTAQQCCPRHAGLPARCGSSLQRNDADVWLCEYPGLSFQRSPVCACSLVSSLLLSGATMSQQPSLTQSAHSVRQVLTAYMQLSQFAVDDSPHNRDGLVLHGWDGDQQVIGFISRRVIADWAEPGCYGKRKSLFREQYNALGKRNLAAIEQIVTLKYRRGAAFNRQHPFVDILLSDIAESGEVLDASELVREPPLPSFQRM